MIMLDIFKFLNDFKSLIIAPAGYGKTHTIVDCLHIYEGKKKILVLTHTHAGIASLKEKIEQAKIPNNKYELDTICSHALHLTQMYHVNNYEIPSSQDLNVLFEFALIVAEKLYRASPIKEVLQSKYDHVIVDEYQDCSQKQHDMIMRMAETLKTHLLGDPLQGIFSFRNSKLVEIEVDERLEEFRQNCQTLEIPWRWRNVNQNGLGEDLKSIRDKLLKKVDVDLSLYKNITCIIAPPSDCYKPKTLYKRVIWREANNSSLLVIHPVSENIAARESFISHFNFLNMIESIDDKGYYYFCAACDEKYGKDLIGYIIEFCRKIFLKSIVDKWFATDTIKTKRSIDDKKISSRLSIIISELLRNKRYIKIVELISLIGMLPGNRTNRIRFVKDLMSVLKDADMFNITAVEALKKNRDKCRRVGRKVVGKNIGTTLLTKGLEYDTVVVLDAQKYRDPKNLYVALTRCCKRLIIITDNRILHPYR